MTAPAPESDDTSRGGLVSLTYLSSAVEPWPDAELRALLRRARATNEAIDITGMLLYAGGNFIQTLEGPSDAVDRVMDRVLEDSRHGGVFIVRRDDIAERIFAGWAMGFRSTSVEEADEIPGFTDYLRTGRISGAAERRSAALTFHRVFRSRITDIHS
ncbi:BLUF domain-containing protein [Nocardioides hwasunensis]|uniref:BLUF domain-containing protein n=1 Tax=Nocardioides hwasunensis TaxID=397258 RepID=A0ABR8MKG4_9ACTN|nr:BLUF domain-containing protein [Nocardioides hwasunensis]MBD3914584.1 BLUF domain-containing protein [Nocardioides hwasunensis]